MRSHLEDTLNVSDYIVTLFYINWLPNIVFTFILFCVCPCVCIYIYIYIVVYIYNLYIVQIYTKANKQTKYKHIQVVYNIAQTVQT